MLFYPQYRVECSSCWNVIHPTMTYWLYRTIHTYATITTLPLSQFVLACWTRPYI